jgi:hypothetical protein
MSNLAASYGNIIKFQHGASFVANENANENQRIIEQDVISAIDRNLSKNNLANSNIDEILFDNKAALKTIAVKYGLSFIDQLVKSQLFKQIDWLLDVDSWEEGDILADADSFKTLMKFILNTNPVQAPYLGLANNGNILATFANDGNDLTLECYRNDRIKWFVSCVFSGEIERTYGDKASIERLQELLKPFENAGWFKKNEKAI